MVSFREQMQRLADNIVKTRNERKEFVAQNHKDCVKKRKEVSEQRNQTKRELVKQASVLTKTLEDFNRNNKKMVARSLRDTRSMRLKHAKTARNAIKQDIAKNRREIARMLRQNNSDRKRMARQQDRAASLTIQSVKMQVQRIRGATKRMTRAWAIDRLEAKQIWIRMQSRTTVREAIRTSESVSPVVVSTAVRPAWVATTPSLSLSGIPLPPNPITQSV